ncbi:MAG: hypothetical protein M3Q97_11185 [Bacteroidota bacterium]|nr:hypothetical protein [Bacteroidota bacterium]
MKKLFVLFIATVALIHCEMPESPENNSAGKDTIADKPSPGPEMDEWVSLRDYPIGATVPEISKSAGKKLELKQEVSSDTTLQEAHYTPDKTVFGKQPEIEFNFKEGILYSLYVSISDMLPGEGERVYKMLQSIYEKRYGIYKEEVYNEGSHNSKASFWNANGFDMVVSYNVNNNAVSWGKQEQVGIN